MTKVGKKFLECRMGISLPRAKPRNWLLTFGYATTRIISFLPARARLAAALDLGWFFNRQALELSFQHYRWDQHPMRRDSAAFLLGGLQPGQRVLDLGCGVGDLSALIAPRVGRVVGIDHSESRIQEAKAKHKLGNLEFQCGDAFEYVDAAATDFDVLILTHVLEHLDDAHSFLVRCRERFESVFIEVPDFQESFLNLCRVDLARGLVYSDLDHVREYDRDELRNELVEAGWVVAAEDHRYGFLRFWCQAGRLRAPRA